MDQEGGPSHDQPKYKGVRLRKWGKWVSEVRLPNSRERIWLGSYDTAEKAARAFDAAQFCLRGPKAKFNFPDNPPNISGGQRLSPAEIQAVAARFANDHSQSSVVQEIRPDDHEGNMGNINSHVINMEKEEISLSSTNCEVVQMDTISNNNNNTVAAEMDWAFFDMTENYSYHHASGPPPEFFCDPYHPGGGGVLDCLSSNLYSPPHFPQRATPNYDDDDIGNGGDEHYSQQSFLWNF
ncbi:ethylene-responsive transcription factor ERF017-like [Solanum dulcamara]|uniref:ethylene-responsive transcription factor ERF017-like n=1 Tax=Solanum dulcamara TaxID=45834 RepID=UPI002484E38A|nr:ethylene-responsive transcription factor ERF017-like [Solanum dulcamara]